MSDLKGKQATFYFNGGAELHGVIEYAPVATGDFGNNDDRIDVCFILATEYMHYYIQNYAYMCISKPPEDKT